MGWGSFCPSCPLSSVWGISVWWRLGLVSPPNSWLPLHFLSQASSLAKFQLHPETLSNRPELIDTCSIEGPLNQTGTRAPCVLSGPGPTAWGHCATVTPDLLKTSHEWLKRAKMSCPLESTGGCALEVPPGPRPGSPNVDRTAINRENGCDKPASPLSSARGHSRSLARPGSALGPHTQPRPGPSALSSDKLPLQRGGES